MDRKQHAAFPNTAFVPLGFVFGPMAGERVAASFEPLLAGLAAKAEAAQQAAPG